MILLSSTDQMVETVIVCNPVSALLELIHQAHDVQRVQAVHDGGTECCGAEYTARVSPFAHGS